MTSYRPCPTCGASALGPFALAMHLARRHAAEEFTEGGLDDLFANLTESQREAVRAETRASLKLKGL